MKEITIESQKFGKVKTQVDDEDYDRLRHINWNVSKSNGNMYISCYQFYPEDKNRKIKLHQAIMLPYDRNKYVIDHIDNDALNNTKSNLRLVSMQQNAFNRRPWRSGASSIFKGVTKRDNRWTTQIGLNRKKIYGRNFKSEIEAAYHYNQLSQQYYGEFAYQNPITATKYKDGTMYVHEKKTGAITELIHQFVVL